MKKSVILIEDYQLIRETYIEIINSTTSYKVVGDFESCEDALPKLKELMPDIVFLDITLPGMNGMQGIHEIKQVIPNVQIIMVTVHEQANYIFQALCTGAIGYITKTSGKKEILEALSELERGGAPMSSGVARKVVESFKVKKFENLTERENEVLDHLASGKSYALIADTMFLSLNTIKTHIRNIYEKLQVNSKDEVIKLYNDSQ
ncbi:response regulator transcription factor [Aquimarina sp. 2201CG1-2-11]|uniref:response regulator n=1 Tax=Aquimarina discodermiae TaxID=3231043 RepID=UPI003461A2F4